MNDSGHLEFLAYCGGVILIITALTVVVLRRIDPAFTPYWHARLVNAFYHVISVAITSKSNYKGLSGPIIRLIAALWIISGVTLVAYVTSTITSVMTTERMRNAISGPHDLDDKSVGVIAGTTSEQFAKARGWIFTSFADLPRAVDALVAQDIQAIVYDAPVLEYFDHQHPKLPITEVGPIFTPQKYAFALRRGNEFRSRAQLAKIGHGKVVRSVQETARCSAGTHRRACQADDNQTVDCDISKQVRAVELIMSQGASMRMTAISQRS